MADQRQRRSRVSILAAALALALTAASSRAASGDDAVACGPAEDLAMARIVGKVWDETLVVAGVCKPWPGPEALLIAAYIFNTRVQDQKMLAVALLEAGSARVVATYKTMVEEDATTRFSSGSLRLDTARYRLNKHIRAFGLDIKSDVNQHCVEAGYGPERTLFIREGKRLRPVLGPIHMTQWTTLDGAVAFCKLNPDEGPEVVSEHFDLSLAIGPTQTNGFADLIVTGTSRYDNGSKSPRAPFRYIWRFDGKRYPESAQSSAQQAWMDAR